MKTVLLGEFQCEIKLLGIPGLYYVTPGGIVRSSNVNSSLIVKDLWEKKGPARRPAEIHAKHINIIETETGDFECG